VNHSLDQTFLLKVCDSSSCERTVDLHSVDEGGLGDDSVGWDFLYDSVAESGLA
jgi:hypothetical protein